MNDDTPSTPSVEGDAPIIVYRTQLLHEADMVCDAMSRAQIPYFRRAVTVDGQSIAMSPAPPPGLLPGNSFAVAVPGRWADRARRLVAGLPVSQEIRSSHRMPRRREMFQGWTWIFVVAILLLLILGVIRMYLL